MPGPRPKPAAIKAQKAPVRSTRKAPAAAPPATASRVLPPEHLKGKALAEWNSRAPDLMDLKLLTRVDAGAFARYCQITARWWGMMEILEAEGEFYQIESNHGKRLASHPLAARADALENRLIALEDRFGLNPAERQRIMQARAQGGFSGDLFSGAEAPAKGEPGSPVSVSPSPSPVGLLN